MYVEDMLFVGFNKQVAALDAATGQMIWQWKAPKGTGFVSLLLDGERLFVAVHGYIYCLDAVNGDPVWANPMKTFGYGVTSLTTSRGQSEQAILDAARTDVTAEQVQQAVLAAATGGATGAIG